VEHARLWEDLGFQCPAVWCYSSCCRRLTLILISLRNKSTSLVELSLFSIVIFQSDCSTLGEITYPGLVRLVGASVIASSVLADVGESGAGAGFVLADEVEALDKSIANVIDKGGNGE
jgi:hypothetical protein